MKRLNISLSQFQNRFMVCLSPRMVFHLSISIFIFLILNAQFPVFRLWGLFWMFLLFLDSASCRKWEFERALTPKHTNQILLLIKEWIWFFYLPAIPLVAFSGQKLAEVVQNQYWPAAKLFIFSFGMLQDYCNLKFKAFASEGEL